MLNTKLLKSLNVIWGGGAKIANENKVWPKTLFNIPHKDPLKLHFIMALFVKKRPHAQNLGSSRIAAKMCCVFTFQLSRSAREIPGISFA